MLVFMYAYITWQVQSLAKIFAFLPIELLPIVWSHNSMIGLCNDFKVAYFRCWLIPLHSSILPRPPSFYLFGVKLANSLLKAQKCIFLHQNIKLLLLTI